LKLVCFIARVVDNLHTNFGISGTFRSRLIGLNLSDASRDLATLAFDLGGHGADVFLMFIWCITVSKLGVACLWLSNKLFLQAISLELKRLNLKVYLLVRYFVLFERILNSLLS